MWAADKEKAYVNALISEINTYAEQFPNILIQTIFFGGGTPTLLRTHHIQQILNTLLTRFDSHPNIEITMEMNPELHHLHKLQALYQLGINRISLGVQSLIKHELKRLGRRHTPGEIRHSFDMIKTAGFSNISADYMFGLPQSTLENVQYNLQELIELEPSHISTYHLSIEPNTDFYRQNLRPITPKLSQQQYHIIRTFLIKNGYPQYEISNFSKPGYQSHHNLAYWTFKPYIGLGPSAHSFFNQLRYRNVKPLHQYIQSPYPSVLKSSKWPKTSSSILLKEYIMVQLRLTQGINLIDINHRFNINFLEKFRRPLHTLSQNNLLSLDHHSIRTTPKGAVVLDEILQLFM